MNVSELVRPDQVMAGLRARDKAQVIAELSERAGAALQREPRLIEAALMARERLGSTGLGRGFALPHARIEGLPGFFGQFAVLARPVDFEAVDGQPVDLVFALLIPVEAGSEHVAALAAISRRMRDQAFTQRLRTVSSPPALYNRLIGVDP